VKNQWSALAVLLMVRSGFHAEEAVRVLLIDDDSAFTALLAEYLVGDGFACERAGDPVDGLERALTERFDAVILDVMMPRMDGMELLRRLRRELALPVLMLTARGDSIDRIVGLELGADDYVPKPVHPRELAARLRAVLRRQRAEPAGAARDVSVGPLRLAPASRESWLADKALILTVSEFDLLLLLARRPGEVVTKDELFERALRRPREPYDRSVDVHVSNLRQKLGAFGGGVEIETARAIGYRLRASQ
jgi:DNA-binding response OmpR family regulator